MNWMESICEAVDYIEKHITDELTVEDISNHVCISPFYFQKGFSMLCGYTIMEYIRNRRLALAGGELATSDVKVIDLALKYGYDSPDSFTKAFTRFHNVTPTMIRKDNIMLVEMASMCVECLELTLTNRWGVRSLNI